MKRRSLILITVLMIALLFSSITAVSARSNASGPIKCVINIAFDEYPDGNYWYGPVTGCSLEGTIKFEHGAKDNYNLGNTKRFFEEFTIWPASGGEIHGFDEGVWNFSALNFWAKGEVTGASEEWAYLIGYKYQETGTTSDPDVLPITAPDTRMILH